MKLNSAKILKNIKISKDTYLMQFKIRQNVFPTQFIMIDTYPYRFLLKPFIVANFEDKVVSIIYKIISDGTKWLSTKKINDEIKFLGPFGNVEKIKNLKVNQEDNIVFIAGGSGIASVIFLYKYFSKFTKNLKVFYGEKNKSYVIDLKKFGIKDVFYTTDDGSYGERGFVTEVFKSYFLSPQIVFCCGPKEMIKNLKQIMKKYPNTKFYALMEEYICCGVGLCRSCVVKVKNNNGWIYETVCKEGPMFEVENLIL